MSESKNPNWDALAESSGAPSLHSSPQQQPVGHFIPDTLQQRVRVKIIRAEALWRSGLVRVTEIAERVSCKDEQVYEWAKLYHWPARADLVESSQQNLRLEQMRRAATNLQKFQRRGTARTDTPSSGSARDHARADAAAPGILLTPSPPSDTTPAAVRATGPLENPEAFPSSASTGQANEGIREAAAADAATALVVDEFTQVLATVADAHQKTSLELMKWGDELMRDARRIHRHHRRVAIKHGRSKDKKLREHAADERHKATALGIANFRAIVAAQNVVMGMARRTFMLDGPKNAPWVNEEQNSGGIDMAPTPVIANTANNYESYIAQAEREGRNMIPV